MTDASAESTRSWGDDRDWLLRFSPPGCAAALDALFEIEHEVTTSLRADLEHEVAHVRLAWWNEELARLVAGEARHPATRRLTEEATRRHASPPDLRPLIEHVRVDLARVAFLSRAELDSHLSTWGSSLFRTAALLDDGPSTVESRAEAERLAARAGGIVRELELLREFSRHAIAGRIYLPLGDPPEPHGRWTTQPLGESERALLAQRRVTLIGTLRALAADTAPAHRPHLRIALLWMSFASAPARHPTARLAPLRRTIGTWRSALALSRGRLPDNLTADPQT